MSSVTHTHANTPATAHSNVLEILESYTPHTIPQHSDVCVCPEADMETSDDTTVHAIKRTYQPSVIVSVCVPMCVHVCVMAQL